MGGAVLSDLLRFVNLFCAAIAAGTFVTVLLALIPIVDRLTPSMGLQVRQGLDPLVDRYNPPAVAAAMLTALAILAVRDDLTRVATVLYLVGVAGMGGVAVMSLGFNMRINRLLAGWSPEAVPAEYKPVLQRWNRYHRVRTGFGLVALGSFIAATL